MRKKAARSVSREAIRDADSLALARGLLVLVELGAEWPGLLGAEAGVRRVVTQLDGETPAQFAARASSLFDGVFNDSRRHVTLATTVIACNERLDAAAESARRKLAGLALGTMAKHKAGKVYLTASERSGARLRQALTSLSQGLFDEWRTAGLEVSVSCGEERRQASAPQVFAFTARVA